MSGRYLVAIDDTASPRYTDRLSRKEGARWKKLFDVQRPYRWNLRRLDLGYTLDLGCGLGRNLSHLEGNAVGIDHNQASVAICRERGYEAYTPQEFAESERSQPATFDSLLASHLVEHVRTEEAVALLRDHLGYIRPGGKVVVITPQRRGFASDETHVVYVDNTGLVELADALGLRVDRTFSFPFPAEWVGRVFTYNEFVLVAARP